MVVIKKYHQIWFTLNRAFHTNIRLSAQYTQFRTAEGIQHLGVLTKNKTGIISLSSVSNKIPNNLINFLHKYDGVEDEVHRICCHEPSQNIYKLDDVKILAPLTKPDKIICVGLNYRGHCDEQNKPYPEQPFFFNKFPSTIIGPNDFINYPINSKALDWEVELAVIIGKAGKNIDITQAYDHIFGYTIAQDISARDWQTPKKNNGQWIIAKSMDQSCPLGPVIVTKEDIPDPHNLEISCKINGVLKQQGNTNELIHPIDKLVSVLSQFFTLLPGDVILTGTPSGVGVFRNPKEFLQPGDKIQSEISSIGSLIVEVQYK